MGETSLQTPQLKRFQLSLKALFAAMVGASIYVGFLVAHPQTTGALTLAFLLVTCLAITFLKGFYWLGLSLMLFVSLIFFSAIAGSSTRICTKHKAAQSQIEKFSIALVMYESRHREFPSNTLNKSSAVDLYVAIDKSKMAQLHSSELQQNGSTTEIVSPWGYPLHYQRTVDASGQQGYVLIATGADGLLGGTLSHEKGFLPDNSDANGDGVFDHEDNIVSVYPSK